jgi:UDP-galactopyranose mutase
VISAALDIICCSHLRWDFVHQRPQHLMSRFAVRHRVFFIEEPIPGDGVLGITSRPCGVEVLVPQLRVCGSPEDADQAQQRLIEDHLRVRQVTRPLLWYYTPMALPFTRDIEPAVVVYDCMDELTAFLGAPSALAVRERELFDRADIVFTGGHSLFRAKRAQHPHVHPFPSSVDVNHFGKARNGRLKSHDDRASRRSLQVGYMGVVDERFDAQLIADVARARPDWRIVILGPVVKIDPASLPRVPNVVYTGLQRYEELPDRLSEWDVALIPFVRAAVTRYVSPTKLLEYFAAGLPVVSTSIPDVVDPYGNEGQVKIADEADSFMAAIESAASESREERLRRLDDTLATTSWDRTWEAMSLLIEERLGAAAVTAVIS